MSADRVGLIGLGLLGTAIAERLQAAGLKVFGFDVDARRQTALGEAGVELGESAADVALACEKIVLSLPDSKVVRGVLEEIGTDRLSGQILLDTTTGAPSEARAFGEMLETVGGHYLDTTVGGSSEQVRLGEAIVLAGGDAVALNRCMPILRCLAHTVYRTGACGTASSMKLVLNLVLGLNRAALAEGLSLAKHSGLSTAQALEVLLAGPAHSRAMERKGDKMLHEEFTPEARLSQHLKDVHLILEEARRHGARLPLSEQHAELLEAAVAMGFGSADNSAVIKAFG